MRHRITGGLILLFCGLLGASAMAHHAFATEFDATKPITLRGVVTKVEWTNPHVWFYLNVKNEQDRRARKLGLRNGRPEWSPEGRMEPEHDQDRRGVDRRRVDVQERKQERQLQERDDREHRQKLGAASSQGQQLP